MKCTLVITEIHQQAEYVPVYFQYQSLGVNFLPLVFQSSGRSISYT